MITYHKASQVYPTPSGNRISISFRGYSIRRHGNRVNVIAASEYRNNLGHGEPEIFDTYMCGGAYFAFRPSSLFTPYIVIQNQIR